MNASLAQEWISRLAAWSAETSLAVLLPALVVLGLSRLRLIPARWCALLAALLLVRLLLPEVLPVSWRAVEASVPVSFEMSAAVSSDASDLSDPSYRTGEAAAAPSALTRLTSYLPGIWALGAFSVLGWLAFSSVQIRRLTKLARPADAHLTSLLRDCARAEGLRRIPRLAVIEGLPSVAVHGLVRPLLLLPADAVERHTTAELRGIFLHELQHLKRADCAWTWLGLVACAVHWFNPLAWLLFRRFCADRELACDEAALHHMHQDARRSYGEALIKTAELQISPVPALLPSFSSNPSELKHRMKLIMKPASSSFLIQLVSATVGVGIATFAFTTARADGERKKSAEGEGKEEVRKAGREGDGERKKEGARDGDGARKEGARDGEGARKEGARDGEARKTDARDGEGERKGPRDGEMKKSGAREGDGERKKEGARDGEGAKRGARDGDGEGEGMKRGAREGEGGTRKSAEGEGGSKMREGERGERPATKSSASSTQQLVIQVNADGDVVNSQGDVIGIKMVRGRMKEIADENPDQSVILRADSKTEIGKVRAVLDALKDVGLKDVKLETK